MGDESILRRIVRQPKETTFHQQKVRLSINWLIASTVIVFALETLLMVALEVVFPVPRTLVLFLDGLLLVGVLLPINYYFIVRPMAQQIEEHRHTNQELVQTNEVLERFFSISDVLIAYLDADFNFIRVNRAYAATDERDPDDFIGINHFALFPDAENQAIFTEVVRSGQPYYAVEKPFEYAGHPERGITYWDWSLLPVKGTDAQVVALILVLTNVTSRKQAQLALTESERRFRGVFNQTFQHMVLLDPAGTALLVNQSALDFFDTPAADLVGKALWQFPWWNSAAASIHGTTERLKADVALAAAGMIAQSEQWVRRWDGELATVDITLKPLLDESGNASLLIYEAHDITHRIQSEDALKRSEQEIKRLYHAETTARQFADTLRTAVLALSRSLDSDTVLQILLDQLHKVVPYLSAHVMLLEDEDHLTVRIARGEETWEEPLRLLGRRFDLDQLLFFDALLRERTPYYVPDTFLDSRYDFLPVDRFVRSWLGIPLQAGDQVIGVCMLEHECPNFFTDELIHSATALAGQAAVAIQNAWLFEQVREGRELQQALTRRLVEVQEFERHYIARELHDESGQALASLMMGLRHLERESGDQPHIIQHCQELKNIADGVLEDLHRLAINLRPAALDHLGLVAALRQHAEMLSLQQQLTVQFETVGRIERLPGEVETAIYRIVQESLTNVVRHAQASRADILLERRDNKLIVIIEDNGIGFDPQTPKVGHLGMLGMHERAEMLGGKITIESAPGMGSTVLLEVPWQSES